MKGKDTIRRSPKNKENPYAQIARSALRDKRLSWKARGILAYTLSNADDWKIYISELEKHSDKDGRESTGNGVKELIDLGYIERIRKQGEDGRFAGYDYQISDLPVFNEKKQTVNGFPVNGESVYGKPVNGLPVNGKTVNGKPATKKEEKKEETKGKEEQIRERRFSPPTLAECSDFFKHKGEAPEEGEKFFYFYESKNWFVGRNKMKNWSSAASGWISRNKTTRASAGSKKEKNEELSTVQYD